VANVTLTIDERVLRAARIRALEQGTSVNAVVRDYLEHYAGSADARAVVAAFLALAEESGASSGRSRSWSRDELYER
jgi:glycine/D-amino acid oxidase-like deaminating enzyme